MQTADSIESIISQAREYAAVPLWTMPERLITGPSPRAIPFVWPYAPLRDLLVASSDHVSAEEAGRRVFVFVNPAAGGTCTTDTLSGSLQCILQGERAPAHRHTMFALRFIIEGSGAYTSVNGERLWMEPGDLILTPSWSYHDHGKEQPGPMLWLDGLDIPLFQFLRIGFQDSWAPARDVLVDAPPDTNLRFAWTEMRARLDGEPGPYAMLPYLDRNTGSAISKTIGAQAERVGSGVTTPLRRSTASHIYSVIAGHGRTRIGEATLEWSHGDTISIPAWHVHQHQNTGSDTAYLFSFSDRALLENIGLYREAVPTEGGSAPS